MPNRIRQPAVADMFYPGDPILLRRMVRKYLEHAPAFAFSSQTGEPLGEPVAMVAPHAGYSYSGPTAAIAYNTLRKSSAQEPRRVFLLAPSHRVFLEGVSLGDYEYFRTPLGLVPVDQNIVMSLAQEPDVSRSNAPHAMEHALEVHLPFLQETVEHFILVPLVYGRILPSRLAELLIRHWQSGDLIIASSDLSHFHPYDHANRVDSSCHEWMVRGNKAAGQVCEACGKIGMEAVLTLSNQHQWRAVLADYRNSGDTAGDKERVVGYASYLFFPQGGVS